MKRFACLLTLWIALALLLSACASRTPELIEIVVTRVVTPTPFGYVPPTVPPPTAAPTATPTPRLTYLIAFSYDGGIWVMNADGTGLKKLTDDGGYYKWSPDGMRIAFVSDRDDNEDVYVMNADGTGVTRLTSYPADDTWDLQWSPDGKRILFTHIENTDGSSGISGDDRHDVCVVAADGTGLINFTDGQSHGSEPQWSPDGQQIAFQCKIDDNWEICVMNADGSGLRNVTNHSADDWFPLWSPDGRQILFGSRGRGQYGIYLMNADGTGVRLLLPEQWSSLECYAEQWSPNRRSILLAMLQDHQWDIGFLDVDGAGLRNLTNDSELEFGARLSPDDRQIVFVYVEKDTDGDGLLSPNLDREDLYVMNSDGTGWTNLTNHPSWYGDPEWSPVLLPALPESGLSLSTR